MTSTIEQLEEMLARATAQKTETVTFMHWNLARANPRTEIVEQLPTLITQIRALEAENKAMREALEPFAEATMTDAETMAFGNITLNDVRRARAALKEQ